MTAKFNRAQEIELAFQKSILLSMNRVERRLVNKIPWIRSRDIGRKIAFPFGLRLVTECPPPSISVLLVYRASATTPPSPLAPLSWPIPNHYIRHQDAKHTCVRHFACVSSLSAADTIVVETGHAQTDLHGPIIRPDQSL